MNPLVLVFLLVVAVVCIVAGLLMRSGRGEPEETAGALEDVMTHASDLMVATKALTRELERTGSEVAEQSTEHLRALKMAVAEADKRLETLSGASPVPHEPLSTPAPAAPPDPAPPAARVDVTVDDAGVQPTAGQGRRPDRYEAIYSLADQGHTVEEIAQQMQMGKGEVQLILSLRRP